MKTAILLTVSLMLASSFAQLAVASDFKHIIVDGSFGNWAAAPSGVSTNFEFRISRKATYDFDSLPVFTGDTIALILEAENSHFATEDRAPDDHGLVYTFSPAPPSATSNSQLTTLTGSSWQVNASGSDLGTAWREVDFDDTQAGWNSGAGLFGFPTNAAAFPAAIQTPLANAKKTNH